jgi:hypothetical protein
MKETAGNALHGNLMSMEASQEVNRTQFTVVGRLMGHMSSES